MRITLTMHESNRFSKESWLGPGLIDRYSLVYRYGVDQIPAVFIVNSNPLNGDFWQWSVAGQVGSTGYASAETALAALQEQVDSNRN